MIKIAIVEDDKKAAYQLIQHLHKYEEENETVFEVDEYRDATSFLTNYKPIYDIVFMDIELPHLDGMRACEKLRTIDDTITIIFVTNMAQFAVKGYEVQASGFIVKPISYPHLTIVLKKAISRLLANEAGDFLIPTQDGVLRINLTELKYVEVSGHNMIYHLDGKDINVYGTLKKIESLLLDHHFVRCNSCYLVNLRYVTDISGFTVTVGGEKLQISHARKKTLMRALNNFIGGNL